MTFIDLCTSLVILSLFFAGFSQSFLPAYSAWEEAMTEYRTAKTIQFVAESFRNECAKPDRNMERWKKTVSVARELAAYEIQELKEGGTLRALKAICTIGGERIEIIGLCVP